MPEKASASRNRFLENPEAFLDTHAGLMKTCLRKGGIFPSKAENITILCGDTDSI
jgi:hypothetical protein